MPAGARPPLALLTLLVAVGLVMAVKAVSPPDTPEIQLQLGTCSTPTGASVKP